MPRSLERIKPRPGREQLKFSSLEIFLAIIDVVKLACATNFLIKWPVSQSFSSKHTDSLVSEHFFHCKNIYILHPTLSLDFWKLPPENYRSLEFSTKSFVLLFLETASRDVATFPAKRFQFSSTYRRVETGTNLNKMAAISLELRLCINSDTHTEISC